MLEAENVGTDPGVHDRVFYPEHGPGLFVAQCNTGRPPFNCGYIDRSDPTSFWPNLMMTEEKNHFLTPTRSQERPIGFLK